MSATPQDQVAVDQLAMALLDTYSRADHAGLCPVWASRAPFADCNCWMKPRERKRAADVVAALERRP